MSWRRRSGLAAELDAEAVPAIEGVLELLADEDETAVAGGTRRNRAHAEDFSSFAGLGARGAALARLRRDDLGRTAGGALDARPGGRGPGTGDRPAGRGAAGDDRGQLRLQTAWVSASGSPTASPPRTPTASEIQLAPGTTSGISATTTAITSVPSRSPSISSRRRRLIRSGIAQAQSSASAAPLPPEHDRDRCRRPAAAAVPAHRADREQRQHRQRPVAALEQPAVERDRAQADERKPDVVVDERRRDQPPPVRSPALEDDRAGRC